MKIYMLPLKLRKLLILVPYGGKETIHLLLTTYRQGIMTNSGWVFFPSFCIFSFHLTGVICNM